MGELGFGECKTSAGYVQHGNRCGPGIGFQVSDVSDLFSNAFSPDCKKLTTTTTHKMWWASRTRCEDGRLGDNLIFKKEEEEFVRLDPDVLGKME